MKYHFKQIKQIKQTKTQRTHRESNEQQIVIKWARLNAKHSPCLKWLHSSQSGVKMSAIQAKIAKAEGMTAGISDLFLPLPVNTYAGLYIEMKRPKTHNSAQGRLSEAQKEFLDYANSVGYKAVVCYGAEEAISEIQKYILNLRIL